MTFCRTYPILPHALATDIQQFSESDYARQYFSTHRTGFIFRRRVPVAQLMTWQKVYFLFSLPTLQLTTIMCSALIDSSILSTPCAKKYFAERCSQSLQGHPTYHGRSGA